MPFVLWFKFVIFDQSFFLVQGSDVEMVDAVSPKPTTQANKKAVFSFGFLDSFWSHYVKLVSYIL